MKLVKLAVLAKIKKISLVWRGYSDRYIPRESAIIVRFGSQFSTRHPAAWWSATDCSICVRLTSPSPINADRSKTYCPRDDRLSHDALRPVERRTHFFSSHWHCVFVS